MIRLRPASTCRALIAIAAFLCAVAGFSQDQPGFGLQPGIVSPKSDPQTLTRRILSSTEYRLTPGDAYELVVIIENTERFPLVLGQDYLLDIPYLGTLNVKGMYFAELKQEIVSRIKARIPVQFVDFLLAAPALFDVFIYGGVKNPGIATVNPLSRVSEAILLAGGPVEGASFRRVELRRQGDTRIVDLSRFATEAELDQNPVLQPDDRIYVPQAGKIVEVKGQVKYPSLYELLPGETLASLLRMSGGFTGDARTQRIRILRLEPDGSTIILEVDAAGAEQTELRNTDTITVGSVLENTARIIVDGALYGEPTRADQPAKIPQEKVVVNIPYVENLTLLDVLVQLGGPTPLAEWERSYLRRESGEKIPIMLRRLWESRSAEYDLGLAPGDLIVIPLKVPRVFVAGEVNDSGSFPFNNGYTVSDYLIAAGGVDPDSGDPDRIYFVDKAGSRQRVTPETDVVEPGTLIYVGKNNWALTDRTITRILVITGLISALVAITSDLVDIAVRF